MEADSQSDLRVKPGSPSREEMTRLADKVKSDWQRLGRALGLRDEDLDEIEADVKGIYNKSYAMLKMWTHVKGAMATYGSLAQALRQDTVQRNDLVCEYCYKECVDEVSNSFKDQLSLSVNPGAPQDVKILLPEPFYGTLLRESELVRITELYNKSPGFTDSAHDECIVSAVYLTGPPGSGKSQLARKYGERYFNNKTRERELKGTTTRYSNICESGQPMKVIVATLRAETPNAYLESLKTLCAKLEVKVEQEGLSSLLISDIIKRYVTELQKVLRTVHWFLIIDNVIVNEPLKEFWPRPGKEVRDWGSGRILITTQDKELAPVSAHVYSKTLSLASGMEKKDALQLLELVSELESDENAKQVAEKLNYYPLSLACAAVYVREMREDRPAANFTWKKYLNSLDQYFEHVDYSAFIDNNPCYPQSMLPAAVLSARRMAQNSDVIRAAFEFLSHCTLAPVPLDTVAEYARQEAGSETSDPERLKAEIARCSLLVYPEKGERGVEVVSLHQVMKAAFKQLRHETTTKSSTLGESQRVIYEGVVSVLNNNYQAQLSAGDTDTIVTRILLSPHLQECVRTGTEESWTQSGFFMSCLVNLADALVHVPGSTDSYRISILERAYDIYKKLALCDLRSCRMLRDLGYTYRESGNLDKVIPILEEANNMAERHVEHEWTRERCHVLNILAWTFREMFRLDMAKEYMAMSVALTKDAFGGQHREVIDRLCNYGIILHDRWENEEAIRVLGEAQELIDAHYRDEKFIRAQVINYTAKIHLRWLLGLMFLENKAEEVKQHLDISKALHEEALGIYTKLYGEHKGRFNAGTMMTYAAVLQRCGALDEALLLSRKSVDIYRAAGHIAWPRAATWLADIHLARGEYRRAVDILEDVMKEHEKWKLNISPGAFHPKALLAEARALLGDKRAGKEMLEECVAEWTVKELDKEHYWFARATSFLKSLMSFGTVSKDTVGSS